jgi:hypothetical protein
VAAFQVTDGTGFLTNSDDKLTLSYKVDNVAYSAECTRK